MPVGSIFEEEMGRERERVGDFMCVQIPTQFLGFLFCFLGFFWFWPWCVVVAVVLVLVLVLGGVVIT